jgi:alkanesulfonate monooxygenase SsuD/methylene tetrahydromethanopterin reductase-like flavin-dependent oxidoreductase (luciferase family)
VAAARPVGLGIFPTPDAARLTDVVTTVRLADRLGLDLVGIQDHPYQRRFADPMALFAGLATVTERIRLFPDVANLPLRGPAVLAKQAATIDLLSGGRFDLGIGAGGLWDGIEAMGGPRRTPGEAVAALDEAITVMRALWSDQRGLRVPGDHYQLHGVHGGPAPAHDIGIWVGGNGPRMLALVGRVADGWVPSMPFMPPDRLAEAGARIDDAAVAAGRDPATVRRIYNVSGEITDGRRGEGLLDGPVEQWVETLVTWHDEHRLDAFVHTVSLDDHGQLHRLAEEVAPAVRAATT